MNKQEVKAAIPNVPGVPLDRLSELGDSALAHSIALYHRRLIEGAAPLSSFNSAI